MKKLDLVQMESFQGQGWGRCAAGVAGSAMVGAAGASGNGVALVLGPVGVTWTAIGAIGGALVGAASFC